MTIPKLTLLFFLASIIYPSYAQIGDTDFGARSRSMGHSNATIEDEWSIFNNVGGISAVADGTVCFGYDRYFAIEGFDRVAAAAIQPFQFGTLGASVYRFGDELYNESIISAAYGNKIGFVSLGLRVNYLQIRVEEFGTSGALFFDFGGIVSLIPKLSFGAYISNISMSGLSDESSTEIPVIMKIGFSYRPVKSLKLNIDLNKDMEYTPNIKAGLEYSIQDKFFVRTGLNTDPFVGFFGAGVWLNRFRIDYAVGANAYLGSSHQATVSFTYHKNDQD
ncbi:MAG: hypothetical protein HC819_22065 [Cyclobacteriaceae bacterium]|nr:hypothetical protein [Cyclobacteriaceae bacterium]